MVEHFCSLYFQKSRSDSHVTVGATDVLLNSTQFWGFHHLQYLLCSRALLISDQIVLDRASDKATDNGETTCLLGRFQPQKHAVALEGTDHSLVTFLQYWNAILLANFRRLLDVARSYQSHRPIALLFFLLLSTFLAYTFAVRCQLSCLIVFLSRFTNAVVSCSADCSLHC